MITDIRGFVAETWAEGIRDRPSLNIWEYARKYLHFTPKMGNITGPYDPDLTPYTKLFQEAVTGDFRNIPEDDWWLLALLERSQRVEECFVVKSSQSGFTQAAINATVYIPQFAPGRLLYVLDSVPKAKKVALTRVIPFLKQLCGKVIASEQDLTSTFIELLDMIIEFGGSYSAGLFSEKPLRYAFLDDVEYMVAEGGVAGMLDGVHVIDHVRSRFTTAQDSFLGVFSKPNLESSDFISNANAGSQHRFYVPCPNCNARQVLLKTGLYYDRKECRDLLGRYDLDAVEALTTYRCNACGHLIEEKWKPQMNAAGIMLPKSKDARRRDEDPALVPRRMSMQISDLNSPFPKVKWGILARMCIEAENNPAKLKHVQTNHFAEPWKEKAINLRAENVRAVIAGAINPKTEKHFPDDLDGEGRLKVPRYRRGEIPFLPAYVSATSDVQGDKFKWTVCAFKADGTCALVDYGAVLSTNSLFEMTLDPRSHTGDPYVCLADPARRFQLDHGLIDSGDDTYAIYDFCIRTGWNWYPSKGVGGLDAGGQLVFGRADLYEGTPILRYHYNDYQIKVLYYKHKIERAHDPRYPSPRLYFPEDIEDDFILEQLSESLVPVVVRGSTKMMKWIHDKKMGPNDYGDAMKMQFVIWQIVGPQYMAPPSKPESHP